MLEKYIEELNKKFLQLKEEITHLLSDANRGKYTHLQNYIFFAYKPIFSFTEAILILCENKKSNAAFEASDISARVSWPTDGNERLLCVLLYNTISKSAKL